MRGGQDTQIYLGGFGVEGSVVDGLQLRSNSKINDFSGLHERLGLEYFVFVSNRFIEVNLNYREMSF